jgi:hypothetical protein
MKEDMRQYRAVMTKISLLMMACCLLSCTAVCLTYNHGETLAYWWMNSYLDFEAEQKPLVKQRISELFTWHRKTQLSDYAQLLALGQKQLQTKVTPADLVGDMAELKKRALVMIDKALPALADVALSLHPHQLLRMEKKFISNNDDYRKDYLRGDTDKRQRFRYKKVMKHAEYWFGNFSRQQEDEIRQASDARPLDTDIVMSERLRRQKDIITLLSNIQSQRPSREATMGMLKEYIVTNLDRMMAPEPKSFFEASKNASLNLTAFIINLANSEQKAHAARRAQDLIADCISIRATPPQILPMY